MNHRVFTVYDSKLECYMQPFLAVNKGHAIRLLEKIVHDPKHDFCNNSKDFTLFEIGEYDDLTGSYTMEESKIPVTGLWELQQKEEEPIRQLKGS